MLKRLTEQVVDALVVPEGKAQLVVWDTTEHGFGVVVGKNTSTFIVDYRAVDPADGVRKKRRVVIGRRGQARDDGHAWTVQLARTRARELLGKVAGGVDPSPSVERRARAKGATLRDALEFHISKMERGENRRRKVCSPRSIRTTRGSVELHLRDWLDKPLVDLTTDVIAAIMKRIEADAERVGGSNPANPPGRAAANRIIANVSAIWRSYHKRYGLAVTNPTERLTQAALKPRDTRIADDAFGDWYARVTAMENEVRRDLQLVALFTGVRTDGVRSLRWDDVAFDDDLIHIARAKGDKPYTVPLTPTVRKLLDGRKRGNVALMDPWGGDRGFVFPSLARDGKTVQAVAEVKERRNVRDAKGRTKRDEDGKPIRESYLPGIHAARRTFNSVAIEIGIPLEAREALMNHSGKGVNVRHYGVPQNWEYLAKCAASIEAAIWQRIKGERPARGRRNQRAA